jgi:hypothetical protein
MKAREKAWLVQAVCESAEKQITEKWPSSCEKQ